MKQVKDDDGRARLGALLENMLGTLADSFRVYGRQRREGRWSGGPVETQEERDLDLEVRAMTTAMATWLLEHGPGAALVQGGVLEVPVERSFRQGVAVATSFLLSALTDPAVEVTLERLTNGGTKVGRQRVGPRAVADLIEQLKAQPGVLGVRVEFREEHRG